MFGSADGAKRLLKDVTPGTATGTDWGGSPLTGVAVSEVIVGNQILDGQPVIALESVLPGNRRIPSIAKINSETGALDLYKGFPYSSSSLGIKIAQNSTNYFLGCHGMGGGFGVLKLSKSGSLVKSVTTGPWFLNQFYDIAASETKVFVLGITTSGNRHLYCFSADLSIVWAKDIPFGFGGVFVSSSSRK